jgi:hypothetical protein
MFTMIIDMIVYPRQQACEGPLLRKFSVEFCAVKRNTEEATPAEDYWN